MDRNECLRKVEEMAKDEFHKKFVRQARNNDAFITAMALGIDNISKKELGQLCDFLVNTGIPATYPHSEMELIIFKEVFGSILKRATQIR
ncbi:hypothetical protein E5329_22330 [Petralouisia muris]|uniref:Uncharacterized protein n=1 Tax=Petralouisia muris TaxID=3032872 RepID=A0AC61RQP7_9FIRM|nr:hypothetical protein [Petralouisia muris]TGY91207.1 hypothetical protein E5329_22330 [Petralouisia muris]